ncbi:MAG: alpha/beta fold hydrolase, partial [Deltaproteobacteria bacterium]|nr:alpha/beta fold hydrolase [Deltaproteobacteria bacterium]
PDLKVWHTADLDAEFTAGDSVRSFADYLLMEKQLFDQLDENVYSRVLPEGRGLINRYHRGSRSDPDQWSLNWNRTFELSTDAPRAGVLLLHGMSDSPYSLRSFGQRLNAEGAWVIGLRLPGHGTAPSGLVRVQWEDMDAAVQLAMRRLRDKAGKKPLFIVGYSNGGALAVNYALSSLENSELPPIDGLVLISPAIGVTPMAAMAKWQAKLGRLLGFDKLAWTDILPEYDPFKYNSFAVNAGDQVYRLTTEIQARLKAAGSAGKLNRFPKVLAFQSVVDATVSTSAVTKGLFAQLPAAGHELVLFDINRVAKAEQLFKKDPGPEIAVLLRDERRPYTVSLVTNESEESSGAIVRRKTPGSVKITGMPLGLKWPREIYSLSHVALPFSIKDPLYGKSPSGGNPGIWLGNMELRGERGVLQVSAADMLRLRWNPFYTYMERRLIEFVGPKDP